MTRGNKTYRQRVEYKHKCHRLQNYQDKLLKLDDRAKKLSEKNIDVPVGLLNHRRYLERKIVNVESNL